MNKYVRAIAREMKWSGSDSRYLSVSILETMVQKSVISKDLSYEELLEQSLSRNNVNESNPVYGYFLRLGKYLPLERYSRLSVLSQMIVFLERT